MTRISCRLANRPAAVSAMLIVPNSDPVTLTPWQ